MSPATFAAEKSNSPKLAEALAYKPANAPPAEVRRAARPQKGDLGRAIADRKIEVKVMWNQLVANSSQLVARQARLHRLLFPVRTHVDVPAATLAALHAGAGRRHLRLSRIARYVEQRGMTAGIAQAVRH
jgi:hypothetical protein